MKKSDIKNLIKPIVKECIQEVLLEEGLLSNIVSEVATGLQAPVVMSEQKTQRPQKQVARKQKDYSSDRKKLLDAIGKDAYNGVDLFEGTTPISAAPEAKAGSVDLGEPSDSGVDISNLIGGASKMWDLMK